jgi:hypothetical protein
MLVAGAFLSMYDGYSNAQTAMGAEIRPQLASLQARLAAPSKIAGSSESPR